MGKPITATQFGNATCMSKVTISLLKERKKRVQFVCKPGGCQKGAGETTTIYKRLVFTPGVYIQKKKKSEVVA